MSHRCAVDLALSLKSLAAVRGHRPRPPRPAHSGAWPSLQIGVPGSGSRIQDVGRLNGGVSMFEINLFGPTTWVRGEIRSRATDIGGIKPRQVLEMLALDLGMPVSKE